MAQNHLLKSKDGLNIAAKKLEGTTPTIIFLQGFFSNMEGTKATFLETCCRERGQAYIRFDYRGHGQSDGKFEDGTVTDWLNDSLLILDELAKSPVIIVGSSMGGWIALLAALKRPELIKGLVGIATSPDFTSDIYHNRMTEKQRFQLYQNGYVTQPSEYRDNPVTITKKLITDGRKHLLLHRNSLKLNIPVCLIHGKMDEDVSWKKSAELHQLLGEQKSELILIPDGPHRLSRPKDLFLIDKKMHEISNKISQR